MGFRAQPFGDDILVYQLDKDGLASNAGLQLGDRIVAVNNLNAVRKSFFDMIRYLTVLDPQVELDVEVAQNGSSHLVKISATVVHQPPQYFFTFLEKGGSSDVKEPLYTSKEYLDGIVYLRLRSFVFPATEIIGMIKPLRSAKAVILDLRGNGGGSREITSDFMGNFVHEPFDIAQEISRKRSESIRVKPASPLHHRFYVRSLC